MFTEQLFTLLALSASLLPALASPSISTRQSIDTSVHCGQFDSTVVGPYTLFLDQFGSAGATSGSQCAHVTALSGSTISWVTNWTWTGGNGVKSFSNINLDANIGRELSEIESLQSTWEWSYDITSTSVADVAYDLFTSTSPTGDNINEIMVWLANINAGPISAVFNAQGQAVPAVTNISLEGHTWNLFIGSNGANNVFSFLPTSGEIMSFSADINSFLKFLIANENLPSSQFLKTAQGGTEATSGTGTLTV
ncbi:uncharacterized protein FOMMEDRAFT_138810 [Fomitiporia mediterranea MF3/22]|uniref:uncharacterized protein n=1 Tax=Fomitiporia mediterranea (strain MF3/22) TaxID=694068 RepID=UPI000440996F|nr:uncharacterized protein FOMMEDRAFT_138810 [Fomitiporia mediterranea MF3/22]EJD07169.1 hypothetical protein FOMMEDRAFT_138810 [Fomitiporia mediterranea MF3/22]